MHSIGIRRARITISIAALLCLLAAPALADERPWEQAGWNALEARPLAAGINCSPGQPWMTSQLDTDARSELEYSGSWSLHFGRNFALSIQAPPVEEWAPGLAFELRF